jgi:hypothetical protein
MTGPVDTRARLVIAASLALGIVTAIGALAIHQATCPAPPTNATTWEKRN